MNWSPLVPPWQAISHVLGADCEQSCRQSRADGAEEGRGADALDGRLNSLINIDLVGFNGI